MEGYSNNPQRIIEDCFFEELEKELGTAWLIERIFDRGIIADIRGIRRYYGDKRIKNEVVKIRWLSKETLALFSSVFKIPKEKFLTYQLINGLK